MIGIGSENKGKSTAMVMAIRRHFENPHFVSLFGDLRGDVWREDQLTFKGAKLQEKEANVTAFGMDSSAVSSKHFTDLDIDDPVSFENAQTFASRDKMWNRLLYDVLPTLEPNPEQKDLHFRGTRYHPDDLYGRLYKQPVLNLEIRREKAILNDGTSFWERMFPIQRLLKMQSDNPAAFAAQYQNDVGAMKEMVPIKEAWIRPYTYRDLDKLGLYKVLAIDPGGITEKEENSGMGISLVGAYTRPGSMYGNVYALQSEFLHVDTWTAARIIIDIYEKEKPNRIIVEEVGLQKVFQDVFAEEGRKRGIAYLPIEGMPMGEIKDKITLARSVTHMFTQGQIYMDTDRTPMLYGKLEDYPSPGTDDVNAFLIALLDLKLNWMKRLNVNRQETKRQQSVVSHFGQAVRDRIR